jgi:methionyl-tRNA synthetase
MYITTPIYYVNDVPHVGHAYTTIAADVLARFSRFFGHSTYFLTGTDEHGQKVEQAALKKSMNPQEFVDSLSINFRELATLVNATHDDFIRTTEQRHIKAVHHLWNKLIEKGFIYLGEYAGWYSVRDEAFYQEAELINGKAPTGADVEWVVEPSYFFKLSAFQQPLLDYYNSHLDFIAPDSRRNEVLRFVEGGLTDLSVSRTSFTWGVSVPNDPNHVVYVWLDALTNYITAIGYPDTFNESLFKNCIHIVGKDILRFHAVYWPAFLMAADLPLPHKIFAHGWWTSEGQKMSKSVGNVIDPVALIHNYGVDNVRYFMMREMTFGQDGDFSMASFIQRSNSDLANAYGNLAQRVLSFIQKQCGGVVPSSGTLTIEDTQLIEFINAIPIKVQEHLNDQSIHRVIEVIWEGIYEANRYVDHQKPWSLKNTDVERMNTVLYVLIEVIRHCALLTQSIMPGKSALMLDQLNVPHDQRTFNAWDQAIEHGQILPEPNGVFPRLEII